MWGRLRFWYSIVYISPQNLLKILSLLIKQSIFFFLIWKIRAIKSDWLKTCWPDSNSRWIFSYLGFAMNMRERVSQTKYCIIIIESWNNYIIQQLPPTKDNDKILFPKSVRFNGSISVQTKVSARPLNKSI